MIQASPNANRVLIIARDQSLAHQLADRLRLSGLTVEYANNVDLGLRLASSFLPAVTVVGNDIPNMSPIELSQRIRSLVPSALLPLLLMDISMAIDGRADIDRAPNSIASPVDDLVNRIIGLTEHPPQTQPLKRDTIEYHGLRLDRGRHRALIENELIHLTPTEFNLLWELASRPGFVKNRTDLGKVCRGMEKGTRTRTVDAHVKSIRRKLKRHSSLIETVHGIGYRFREWESDFFG